MREHTQSHGPQPGNVEVALVAAEETRSASEFNFQSHPVSESALCGNVTQLPLGVGELGDEVLGMGSRALL